MEKKIFENRFKNSVAIVTGGASGIGRAVAERFAAEGGKVALFDIDRNRLAEMTELLGAEKCAGFVCDVSDREQVNRAVAGTVERFGGFDRLFNMAGLSIRRPFLETSESDWDALMSVNAKGSFNVSQEAARWMVENGVKGAIVLTASVSAHLMAEMIPAYSASKGAVLSFAKGIALSLAPHGIRVNCLSPGYTRTPMSQVSFDMGISSVYTSNILLGRAAEPEEQAAAALFLSSDDASFLVGAELVPDGGVSIKN